MRSLVNRAALALAVVALCAPASLAGAKGWRGHKGGKSSLVVPCPGTQVDSSQAIQNALLSVRPGGTVELQQCTYYMSGPVYITTGIDVHLKGAGMGKTVITTLPDEDGIEDVLMVTWIHNADDPDVWQSTLQPSLFHFYTPDGQRSDITVSDLTVEITDPAPAFASARADWFAGALLGVFTVEGKRVDSRFHRLEVKGVKVDNGWGTNALYATQVGGEIDFRTWGSPPANPMVGRYVVSESRFENLWEPSAMGGQKDSQAIFVRNEVIHPARSGVQVGVGSVNTVEIVADNQFTLDSDAAIGVLLEGEAVYVGRNRFTGNGASAITLDTNASRSLVVANDLSGLTASLSRIHLDPTTSHNFVVVRDAADVLDEGTDNTILVR